jgi:DNA primase
MADAFREVVRRIKEEADLVTVVGRRVPSLQKIGKSFKGLCPFHNEKTPSFHVVPEKGIYHCFGCKASGSVIDFIMSTEHLEFMEAVKLLAGEMGLEIPSTQTPEQRQRQEERETIQQQLHKVNEFALNWYRENLQNRRNPAANQVAARRDITPELEVAFELGASIDDWARLTHAALANGFSQQLLEQSGLVVYHEQKQSVYDRFRNRLMFPIRDHVGRVIGFGGRRLTDDDPNSPKYLNSSETAVYSKGKSLYGLHLAKEHISSKGYSIITEGYMDTIMAHRFGFTQTVATLGTALTPEQCALLKRYAKRVYFLYDGDSAGQKNMLRSGHYLLEAGLDARIIQLPVEHDPDSFLREKGPTALEVLIEHAQEYFDFALAQHAGQLELGTLAGQSQLVERLAPLIAGMPNAVQREAAISRLVGRLGDLPRSVVQQIIRAAVQKGSQEVEAGPKQEHSQLPEPGALEAFVLKLMLEHHEALNYFRHELDEAWVHHPRFSPWILAFLSGSGNTRDVLEELEVAGEDPAARSILTELMAQGEPMGDPLHSAEQLVARIKRDYQRNIMMRLLNTVRAVQIRSPLEVPMSLLKQVHEEARLASMIRLPKAPLKF